MSRLPSWSVVRLRLFAAATIASAAVISFDSIRHLAESAGFGHLAWLFPLTLDAVAAYGMDLWVRRSAAMKGARALALAAIFGSLVANVVDHYMVQRSILGAVLGAVPPAALAALLAVAHRHNVRPAGPVRSTLMAVRDAVWSSLPQAVRSTSLLGPVQYSIPDRIVTTDRVDRTVRDAVWADLSYADRTTPPDHDEAPDRTKDRDVVQLQRTRRRTSAARTTHRTAGPRRTSASLPDDDAVRAWIADQRTNGGVTKANVMDHFGIGSGKALRLMGEV